MSGEVSFVLSQFMRLTDRQTDGETYGHFAYC